MPKPLSPENPNPSPNQAANQPPAERSRDESPSTDNRDTVAHDRQSHVINQASGDDADADLETNER